ncbi:MULTISPECIES: hypothetical protein [Bacillus cereus group]|uniref:hypothetical protein n=1 Tax=Bacillus cereus group TaxID=86661 RepID=UPI0024BD02F2|nr:MULTISPECIES: hypothetical protein [Bacillus cereus group]MED3396733.1 hypothetical protein [Bacillus wiedmannii]
MGFPTLPTWSWIIYYGFLLVSLLLSIYFLSWDRNSRINKISNVANICFILSVPLFSALNSIGRSGDECDHLQLSFSHGEFGQYIYTVLGRIYCLMDCFLNI